jgi:hypothetical protein
VANIGFGTEATHTFGGGRREYFLTKELSFPLKHPEYVVPDYNFEKMFEKAMMAKQSIVKRVIGKICRQINQCL